MGLIKWDKPKKVISTKEWKEISADSAPPGVYQPNMSEEDRTAWKGKIVGHKIGRPQVEIRKDSFVIIIGGSKGYKYKQYDKGKYGYLGEFHIASAGPILLSHADWNELKLAVDEAYAKLKEIDK